MRQTKMAKEEEMRHTMHTKAYAIWRKHSQEILDFVVTSATAAGYLRKGLSGQGSELEISQCNALFEPTLPPLSTEKKALPTYEEVLAATAFTAHYSQFENYFFSAIDEILDFHGGSEKIRENLERIQSRKPSERTAQAIRKLRTPREKSKDMRYRTAATEVNGAEVVWPSQRFSAWGLFMLSEEVKQKKLKGHRIPDLANSLFGAGWTAAEIKKFSELRKLRNDMAHGESFRMSISDFLDQAPVLNLLAKKTDKNAVRDFLIIDLYST